jgi:Leucine-rich repeat (LRR) protein
MTGPFPEEIFNLTSMERLYLSFNQISGTLPTRIGELTNLREFYAYTNDMTGELPTELGNLAEIESLVIGKNEFEGEITFATALLLFIFLSVPFSLCFCENLLSIKGTLPTQLNNLVNLREFSVYKNAKMSGPILAFSKVTKLEKLE